MPKAPPTIDEPSFARSDAERRARLSRIKAFATALLVLMAVVFVVAKIYEPLHPAIGYVRAFAEAAMIGALADWFAVTALFRHPLGIPIPHTAIVRRRKDEIGRSLARFVREHFLVRTALERKVAEIDFAARLGQWLVQPERAAALTRDAGRLAGWLLRAVDGQALREAVRSEAVQTIGSVPASPAAAALLDALLAGDHAQSLIDTVVRATREAIIANQDRIRASIDERSPWWLPGFVDRKIFDRIIAEVNGGLDRIGDDPAHPARQQFRQRLDALIAELRHDPRMVARGEQLKMELLDNAAVRDYLEQLWLRARERITAQATDPDSALRARLIASLQDLGRALQENPRLAAGVNAWLRDGLVYLVSQYREPIAGLIPETVAGWDADETSRRIELNIGHDLQFIRISGTLVGGLVGITVHALWQAFGS